MRAESLPADALPAAQGAASPKYFRGVVAVSHSARRGEHIVAHFGSGSFFRTDRLGAVAIRALIDGRSDVEARKLVERIEAGAGERARRLIFNLDVMKGALTEVPPVRSNGRWRMRRCAAFVAGQVLSLMGFLIRVMPSALLAWILRTFLASPIAHRVPPSEQRALINNLQARGYTGRELAAAGRPRRSFSYLFMYLSVSLSPAKLNRLVDRLFDRHSADDVAAQIRTAGATVGVWLHGPFCTAVPNALRGRGLDVVRVVRPLTHGINVSASSGPLRGFFGDSSETTIGEADQLGLELVQQPSEVDRMRMVAAIRSQSALLRHLRDGRSVYVGLDYIENVVDPATGEVRKPRQAAEVEMLGRRFLRNDGPAWLAVRSGRPLALWTTHYARSGAVVITGSALLYSDPSLPVEARVAALSRRLYECAEAAILEHPEAWRYWNQLSLLTVERNPHENPEPAS
jgi:hypothetical protein